MGQPSGLARSATGLSIYDPGLIGLELNGCGIRRPSSTGGHANGGKLSNATNYLDVNDNWGNSA